MNVLIIDNGTIHLGKLKSLFSKDKATIIPLFSNYKDAHQHDLIILSGGSQIGVVAAPEVFHQEIELVKKSDKPIIGICEGCEIIAYAYGSELVFLEGKVKGIKKIKVLEPNIFKIDKELEVYEGHQWAIKNLGKDLVEIAKSKYGSEIIKHKEKPIVGVQFHPEMLVDKSNDNQIFNEIVRNIVKD